MPKKFLTRKDVVTLLELASEEICDFDCGEVCASKNRNKIPYCCDDDKVIPLPDRNKAARAEEEAGDEGEAAGETPEEAAEAEAEPGTAGAGARDVRLRAVLGPVVPHTAFGAINARTVEPPPCEVE